MSHSPDGTHLQGNFWWNYFVVVVFSASAGQKPAAVAQTRIPAEISSGPIRWEKRVLFVRARIRIPAT